MDKNVNLNLTVKDRSLLDALDEMKGDLVELVPLEVKAAAATTDFAAALDRLDRVLETVDDDELVFVQNLQAMPAAAGKAAEAAAKATKDIAGMGRAALNASQSFQDLAQGGFPAILNNLPRLTEDAAKFVPWVSRISTAFGGPLGLAATATGVGVAFVALTPLVKAGYDAISRGTLEVPKAADALERLTGEIRSNKREMEDMEENWRGTAREVDAYNAKLAANVELEKKANAERERRSAIEAQRKKEQAGNEEAKDVASAAFDEAGGIDQVTKDLEKALSGGVNSAQADLDRVNAERTNAINNRAPGVMLDQVRGQYAGKIAAAQEALKRQRERLAAQVQEIIGGGLEADPAALAELGKAFPGSAFWQATPDGMKFNDVDADAMLASTERPAGAKERQAARRKKNAEVNKLVEDNQAFADGLGEDMRRDRQRKNAQVQEAVDDAARGVEEIEASERLDAAKAAKANTPAARLRAQRESAYQDAAGIAMSENNGEFTPAQLEGIARDAADNAGGLSGGSIRQAVYRAAAMTRQRIQQDIDREMGRMWQQGESFIQ